MKKITLLSASRWTMICTMLMLVCGCSSTKHVPEGQYLLDNVTIDINGDKSVSSDELVNFLRQTPNHTVLGFARLQLSTYSLSGSDTTKWYNRWLRRLGKPPVIYNAELTDASRRQLRQALINRGYMDAGVVVDTMFYPERKRADVFIAFQQVSHISYHRLITMLQIRHCAASWSPIRR